MSVIVAGGGIAGLASGILLARLGHDVRIAEQHQASEQAHGRCGRTISLALSARGFATLSAIGIETGPLRPLPMHGRMVHAGDVEEFTGYDQSCADGRPRAIYAVRRADLHRRLVAVASSEPRLRIDWGMRCVGFSANSVTLRSASDVTETVKFSALIAADGANSLLRRQAFPAGEAEARKLSHVYVELRVPPGIGQALRRDALHVWPAADIMLVALPEQDGGFCATLFLPAPAHGAPPLHGAAIATVLHARFTGLADWLFPDLHRQVQHATVSPILTVDSPRWRFLPNALLIGDAAHAMAPFYGQGMNCALEDALVLAQCAAASASFTSCLAEYEALRRTDVEAICALSRENYDIMSRPNPHAMPGAAHHSLYESIAFTCTPYAQAVALARQKSLQAMVARNDATHAIYPAK